MFRSLAIHKHWNLNQTYPVIRISFNGEIYTEVQGIEHRIIRHLIWTLREADLQIPPHSKTTAANRLEEVIRHLHHITEQRVVVLIDEYDKPILDMLTNTDIARTNRAHLESFYETLKDLEPYLRFIFIAGITIFTKSRLFSVPNSLKDITLDLQYATICGFTETELDTVFASELEELDRKEIRRWYCDYHWLGKKKDRESVQSLQHTQSIR